MLCSVVRRVRRDPSAQTTFARSVATLSRRFVREDTGSLTIFTLFIFAVMLGITGMAVDLMIFESKRVALQSTLDRAVLAAADMDQTLDHDAVITDFFDKSGMNGVTVKTHIDQGMNHRTVAAASSVQVQPLFVHLLGIDRLDAPASAGAHEGMTRVEISMVLDVSGSMGRNNRLVNLKSAAKDFVDTVIDNDGTVSTTEDLTHISIVPFSTQVNAGATLASYFNYSGEHNASYCVDWQDADFDTTAVSLTSVLRQTGHFDPDGSNLATSSRWKPVCYTQSSREILAFENDKTELKTFIDNLFADGWTSIGLGTKWGAALLDPSTRDIAKGMAAAGQIDTDFKDRPFDYTERDTLKVMIVMSDGANTNQWWLNDDFQSGASPIFYDADARDWTYFDQDRADAGQTAYWWESDDSWHGGPDGSDSAVQLTWPQVWALASVEWVADNIMAPMLNSNQEANAWEASVYTQIGNAEKNARTSDICAAVRNQGVTVYAIGFETDAAGDAALKDCASSVNHFFNAQGTQISDVFASIASDITQLRLTN